VQSKESKKSVEQVLGAILEDLLENSSRHIKFGLARRRKFRFGKGVLNLIFGLCSCVLNIV